MSLIFLLTHVQFLESAEGEAVRLLLDDFLLPNPACTRTKGNKGKPKQRRISSKSSTVIVEFACAIREAKYPRGCTSAVSQYSRRGCFQTPCLHELPGGLFVRAPFGGIPRRSQSKVERGFQKSAPLLLRVKYLGWCIDGINK